MEESKDDESHVHDGAFTKRRFDSVRIMSPPVVTFKEEIRESIAEESQTASIFKDKEVGDGKNDERIKDISATSPSGRSLLSDASEDSDDDDEEDEDEGDESRDKEENDEDDEEEEEDEKKATNMHDIERVSNQINKSSAIQEKGDEKMNGLTSAHTLTPRSKAMLLEEKESKNSLTSSSTFNGRNVLLQNIRTFVSKKKNRHIQGSFNLDLTYITPRIVAMGYPSEGIESTYRNPASDVSAFLDKQHKDHYQVYNLCEERTYDTNMFHGRVKHFPFRDHEPPPLELLPQITKDMKAYWEEDDENILVIHCKAGKGRTGVVIACFLFFIGICATAKDAFTLYSSKRTSNNKGVTIPSQIRYINYFEAYIKHINSSPYAFNFKKRVNISSLEIVGSPIFSIRNVFNPVLKIYDIEGNKLFSSRLKDKDGNVNLNFTKKKESYIFSEVLEGVEFEGDVKISIIHDGMTGDKKLFHFYINCTTETEELVEGYKTIFLSKNELDDAVKDKTNKIFPTDFCCIIRLKNSISATKGNNSSIYNDINNPIIHVTSNRKLVSNNPPNTSHNNNNNNNNISTLSVSSPVISPIHSSPMKKKKHSLPLSPPLNNNTLFENIRDRHNDKESHNYLQGKLVKMKEERLLLLQRVEMSELTCMKAIDLMNTGMVSMSSEIFLLRNHLLGSEKSDIVSNLTKELAISQEKTSISESELQLSLKESSFRMEERMVLKKLFSGLSKHLEEENISEAKKIMKSIEEIANEWVEEDEIDK